MATDDQLVNYLAGDDDGHELEADERHELDEITSLLADPSLWDDPPATLGADVVSAIVAERVAGGGRAPAAATPSAQAATDDRTGTVTPISAASGRRRRWITPFLA